jgi:alkanesulfonate monooxygenase SsuD/methylene tetrahydromethanopterin reductase-like flavin-dependent oxidoreductase (luciferase family)
MGGEGWAWTSETPQRTFGWDFVEESAGLDAAARWTYAELPRAALDPESHLAAMHALGVDAAVVYPLALVEGYLRLGPEIGRACLSAYNDWMAAEFEAHDPSRLLGPRLLPSQATAWGLLRGLERAVASGARAVLLPTAVWLDKADSDALWGDLEQADLTVCMADSGADPSHFAPLLAAHPRLRIVVVALHREQPAGPSAQLFDASDPDGAPMYCSDLPRQARPPPMEADIAGATAARAFRFTSLSERRRQVPHSSGRLRVLTGSRVDDVVEQEEAVPAVGIALGSLRDAAAPTAGAVAEAARRAEEAGFAGVWVGDTVARRPNTRTIDPFALLSVAAAVTDEIELGTCIVQVPLRRRVELAHRALSLHQLASGRFTFGVGAGSTDADFDAVGVPFEQRFRELKEALPEMKALWRGERVGAACLYPWADSLGGPPVLVGSWGGQWVQRAARDADGWIASGTRTWRALADAMRRFREAGGKRAVVSSVFADLSVEDEPHTDEDRVHLACSPEEAARRLRRIAGMGFTDVIVFNVGPPETLRVLASLGRSASGNAP